MDLQKELVRLVNDHRQKAMIMCDEGCLCWNIETLLNGQTLDAEQRLRVDGGKVGGCTCTYWPEMVGVGCPIHFASGMPRLSVTGKSCKRKPVTDKQGGGIILPNRAAEERALRIARDIQADLDLEPSIRALSNDALAQRLVSVVWAHLDIFSEAASTLEEAIERLRAAA